MRILLTLICTVLLAASAVSAQQPAPGGAGTQTSPDLEEAARLTDEVLKLYAAGKFAEALPAATRALELREKELGRNHAQVGGALLNLAAVESMLGRPEDAKGHYRRAVSVFEKEGDAGLRPLINALEGQARVESYAFSSIELYKRALSLKEKTFGPDSAEVARTLFPLGHLNDLTGQREEAKRYFRRFTEVASKSKAVADDDLAVAYLRLGCIARREGKEDEAFSLGQQAQETFKAAADKRGPFEGGVINGKVVSKPQPVYPAEAKRARAEGTVEVEMLVGENGRVLSACATGSADKSLKAASEFAAYNARFTPTLLDGKPVKVRGIITYRFILR